MIFRLLLITLIIFLGTAISSVYQFMHAKNIPDVELVQVETKEVNTAFENTLRPIYAKPSAVYLNSEESSLIKLIEVGVTPEGVLEVPSDWNLGGWYSKSARVGEFGNLIISGHYDDNTGNPAAFWGLKNLRADDTVYVVDAFGRTYPYQVTEIFYVDISDPNRLDVLKEDNTKVSLTLITCGGNWLATRSTYSKRLVVKAKIV